MAIPRSLWWLLVTGFIVLALVGLSMLALDKPNAVWAEGLPHCPHCRHEVALYSHRCPTCREEFDWVATPEDDSPLCGACLLESEAEVLKARVAALGPDATARVAAALEISSQAAGEWLGAIKPGACGWCGGTGRDLSPAAAAGTAVCPACFGEKDCVVCAGDRKVRLGVEAADRDVRRAHLRWNALSAADGEDGMRRELRVDEERLVKRHSGTIEIGRLPFWPRAHLEAFAQGALPAVAGESAARIAGASIASAARGRISDALSALRR